MFIKSKHLFKSLLRAVVICPVLLRISGHMLKPCDAELHAGNRILQSLEPRVHVRMLAGVVLPEVYAHRNRCEQCKIRNGKLRTASHKLLALQERIEEVESRAELFQRFLTGRSTGSECHMVRVPARTVQRVEVEVQALIDAGTALDIAGGLQLRVGRCVLFRQIDENGARLPQAKPLSCMVGTVCCGLMATREGFRWSRTTRSTTIGFSATPTAAATIWMAWLWLLAGAW